MSLFMHIIGFLSKLFRREKTKEKEPLKDTEIALEEDKEKINFLDLKENVNDNLKVYYKDSITLERIKTIHPLLREELNDIYTEICYRLSGNMVVRFSWVLRSGIQQNKLYAKGRTIPGKIVTYAKAGQSTHNYGLAVDIVILIDNDGNGTFESASWDTLKDSDNDGLIDWNEFVEVFKMHGWKWGFISKKGKRWDLPHFQKTFGLSISQLQKLPKDENGYPIIPINNA